MQETQKFAELGRPRRIWAVGAVHAEVGRLRALHEIIAGRFQPGDRLIYLGNLIGRGEKTLAVIEEVLAFRKTVLSTRGVLASDVVFLRGAQEEMWNKLLQLQFAPNPREVLEWMLRQGVAPVLVAYGSTPEQGLRAASNGAIFLGRWTQGLRNAVMSHPGHQNLFSALRRAAYCETPPARGVLLVSAGIDPSRPFRHQNDSFWWGNPAFARIDRPFEGFGRIVRGYDPGHQGVAVTPVTATFDDGCGFGGALVCGCVAADGEVLDLIKV